MRPAQHAMIGGLRIRLATSPDMNLQVAPCPLLQSAKGWHSWVVHGRDIAGQVLTTSTVQKAADEVKEQG